MSNFFNLDGPFMNAMRDLMNLVILNLLTLLCCIPIVTSGAAIAALHYVLMQMVDGTEGHIAGTYFKQFKANLRNATPIALIYLVIALLLFLEYQTFHGGTSQGRIIRIPIYAAVFVLLALYVWVFPLTAKFVYSLGGVFHNALYLAVKKFPRTLVMMAFTAAIPYLFVQLPRLWPLMILLGISLPAYLCALFYYPVFRKIIKKQQGSEASEDAQGTA